jgi:hypothetical protein
VPPIRIGQISDLIPHDVPTAIVHYTLTADRGLALIITADVIRAVDLPGSSANEANDPANAWYRAYYDECREPSDAKGWRRLKFRAWCERIGGLLSTVAERAVRPIVEKLAHDGIKRLILVPGWVLQLFPLHACRLADGRALIDAFDEVIFAPSLSILHRCAGLARHRPAPTRLLTAENPTGDLAFPEIEAAAVGCHFAEHVRRRRTEVGRGWLLAQGAGHDVWHYSGHSFFWPNDPMFSGLLLADGPLTLRDIYTDLRLRDTTLAVLSGCESGGVRPDRRRRLRRFAQRHPVRRRHLRAVQPLVRGRHGHGGAHGHLLPGVARGGPERRGRAGQGPALAPGFDRATIAGRAREGRIL